MQDYHINTVKLQLHSCNSYKRASAKGKFVFASKELHSKSVHFSDHCCLSYCRSSTTYFIVVALAKKILRYAMYL